MARKCENCEKKTTFGNNVSHSKRRTRRIWKANLFKVRVHSAKRTLLCTRCIRSGPMQRKSLV